MNTTISIIFFSVLCCIGSIIYPFANFPSHNVKITGNNWYKIFGKAAILLISAYSFRIYGSYTIGDKVSVEIQQFIWMIFNFLGVLLFGYFWKREKFNYHKLVSIFIFLLALLNEVYYTFKSGKS